MDLQHTMKMLRDVLDKIARSQTHCPINTRRKRATHESSLKRVSESHRADWTALVTKMIP
jgi:hypothetical protein